MELAVGGWSDLSVGGSSGPAGRPSAGTVPSRRRARARPKDARELESEVREGAWRWSSAWSLERGPKRQSREWRLTPGRRSGGRVGDGGRGDGVRLTGRAGRLGPSQPLDDLWLEARVIRGRSAPVARGQGIVRRSDRVVVSARWDGGWRHFGQSGRRQSTGCGHLGEAGAGLVGLGGPRTWHSPRS